MWSRLKSATNKLIFVSHQTKKPVLTGFFVLLAQTCTPRGLGRISRRLRVRMKQINESLAGRIAAIIFDRGVGPLGFYRIHQALHLPRHINRVQAAFGATAFGVICRLGQVYF
jgi:hypothetical protein